MGSFSCNACEFVTDKREKLAGHRSGHARRNEIAKHQKVTKFWCQMCNVEFPTRILLGAHRRKLHIYGSHNRQKTAEEILIKGGPKTALKRSLLEIGRLYQCETCGLKDSWCDEPLSLHVDHKNGDNTDHREDNLRFLCPNCHSQTPTYGSRNCRKLQHRNII